MPEMKEETTTILIDTALASGSATALDAEERALQELVLAIRDDVPVPDPDFRLRMDARVAAGFPRRAAGARAIPARLRASALAIRRPQLAVLGGVASLLVALVVAVALGGGSGGSRSSASRAGGASESVRGVARAPAAKAAPGSAAAGSAQSTAKSLPALPSVAPVEPPLAPGDVRGGRSRRVERSAALVLAAPEDRLSQVGDQVVAVTDRYRGIVMSSSVTDTGNGQGSGSFDLRIPVRNLRTALRDLSALADVQSRTENADDVTASFVSARTRIEELGAERKRLLRRLASATSDNQAAAIRARIRIVNGELDGQTQALQRLSRRTSFATVAVTLTVGHGGSTGGGGIGGGARDLRDSLVDAAVLALRVLGVAIPIALLVALLWAGNAILTRRSREAALDNRL